MNVLRSLRHRGRGAVAKLQIPTPAGWPKSFEISNDGTTPVKDAVSNIRLEQGESAIIILNNPLELSRIESYFQQMNRLSSSDASIVEFAGQAGDWMAVNALYRLAGSPPKGQLHYTGDVPNSEGAYFGWHNNIPRSDSSFLHGVEIVMPDFVNDFENGFLTLTLTDPFTDLLDSSQTYTTINFSVQNSVVTGGQIIWSIVNEQGQTIQDVGNLLNVIPRFPLSGDVYRLYHNTSGGITFQGGDEIDQFSFDTQGRSAISDPVAPLVAAFVLVVVATDGQVAVPAPDIFIEKVSEPIEQSQP